MEKFSARARLARVIEIIELAEKLPQSIDTMSDDFPQKILEAVNVSGQAWGFIKSAYGEENPHFKMAESISFTVEAKGIKVNRGNILHSKSYDKGLSNLTALLEVIKIEETERAKLEEKMMDNTVLLRYGFWILGVLLSWVAIWSAPPDIIGQAFAPAYFLIAKLGLSLTTLLLLSIFVNKGAWKDFLGWAVAIFIGMMVFLKTAPVAPQRTEHADSLLKSERQMLLDSIKKLNSPKR